jgi:branched-chain amino acid transport system ATP-binding protein
MVDSAELVLQKVSLRFGGVQAIRDVSLTIPPGHITAIIGPNGAGKTSVLNVISRFYRPQEGRVVYGDTNLLKLRPYQVIGHGIARSFQNVALFRELTVFDNLLVGADHLSRATLVENTLRLPRSWRYERRARQRAERVLDFLDIGHLRRRTAGELSFGDQKLVDLGRALMGDPSFLMLDEPASGLQDTQKSWLATVVRHIPDEYGATVLLVDHDMGLVLSVSSRVVVMDHGAKIAEGTPEEIRSDPNVIAAYLGEEER